MIRTFERVVGGRTMTIETGKLANQANGAVTVRYGDVLVLVTATASEQPREGIDFFPLTIDYEERLYAAGKIPGSFFRREGRPSSEAILDARLTDRPLRPLFPKGYRNDVQIIITVLSADKENDPDVIATVGASAALCISDIPFAGPVSSVRVGRVNGEFIANPTFAQLKESDLELVVSCTRDAIMMVEAGASEVSEDDVVAALDFGREANQALLDLQEEMMREVGKTKSEFVPPEVGEDVRAAVAAAIEGKMGEILGLHAKEEREEAIADRRAELVERLGETYAADQLLKVFDEHLKKEVRTAILERGVRPDGRDLFTIRPISCEVSLLPRTHGSGLFSRGETQVLTIATLGGVGEVQKLDTLSPEESKRFLHHYNFPPFSVGEARRIGSPGRREIGHGALAERALQPVIPSEDEFPYTIRLVSEVMSSNGSTSMASVCGSTLALLDGGVPIKAPVAGIAMGLVKGEGDTYAVLTDIMGMEDALGDMDFKVAGTSQGITALQMDIKVKGITLEIIRKALGQAKDAREFILARIAEVMPAPREELSRWAPRMYRIKINPEKIGAVIGPGGRMIRSIVEDTKCTIDVEEDGTVFIGSSEADAAQKAIDIIEGLTKEVEVGQIYTGTVTRIVNFGAFVEILPGKEGLIRIGELADYHVPTVEDVVQVGDEVMVMVIEIDNMGRINLSRRAVLTGEAPPTPPPSAPRSGDRGDRPRGGRGGFDRRGGGGGGGRREGGGGRPPRQGGGSQAGGGGYRDRNRRPSRQGPPPERGNQRGPDDAPPPPPPLPRPNLGGRF